ncbi:hypothetical protein DL98DRAFT_661422 [Cadophora sp. DSE1049]|nr:hypothetical protein DL98DRAFT_661422 [Cadophora sp. DSE1049]
MASTGQRIITDDGLWILAARLVTASVRGTGGEFQLTNTLSVSKAQLLSPDQEDRQNPESIAEMRSRNTLEKKQLSLTRQTIFSAYSAQLTSTGRPDALPQKARETYHGSISAAPKVIKIDVSIVNWIISISRDLPKTFQDPLRHHPNSSSLPDSILTSMSLDVPLNDKLQPPKPS